MASSRLPYSSCGHLQSLWRVQPCFVLCRRPAELHFLSARLFSHFLRWQTGFGPASCCERCVALGHFPKWHSDAHGVDLGYFAFRTPGRHTPVGHVATGRILVHSRFCWLRRALGFIPAHESCPRCALPVPVWLDRVPPLSPRFPAPGAPCPCRRHSRRHVSSLDRAQRHSIPSPDSFAFQFPIR